MKICKAFVLLLATILIVTSVNASSAQDAGQEAGQEQISFEESNWERRCQVDPETKKENKDLCEIAKLLRVKDSHGRVAEMAIGRNPQDKKTYSGVVIMPLGILLEDGVLMKVDEGKPVMFKPRFCAQVGCVSYITLNSDLIETMKKGKVLSFSFKSSNGQNVNVDMNLTGFTKAVGSI